MKFVANLFLTMNIVGIIIYVNINCFDFLTGETCMVQFYPRSFSVAINHHSVHTRVEQLSRLHFIRAINHIPE